MTGSRSFTRHSTKASRCSTLRTPMAPATTRNSSARRSKAAAPSMVLATKFGNLGGKDGKFADGRPEFVIESCDTSLKRLGVDVIDLYYQHRIDPTVPIEDTVGAMAKLVAAGQGARARLERSEPRDHQPRACRPSDRRGAERVFAALSRRSGRDARDDAQARHRLRRLLPARPRPADRRGRTVGDLAETDARRRHPRFAPENLDRNVSLVQPLGEIAHRSTARPASSRSPGCWRKATTSFRSPAPSGRNGSRKISARCKSP